MDAGFVTVYETTDPIQAEMLADLLEQEGLTARLLGTRNAPLLGVGQSIIRLRIEVPEHQVADAAALVEAWETAPPLDENSDVGAADDATDAVRAEPAAREADEAPHLSPILAAGVAFVLLGASHIYARRPWTSAVLYAGLAAGFLGAAQVGDRVALSAFSLGIVGVVLFDLIGAQFAVRAYNRGVRLGFWRQIAFGAGALVVVGGAAALIAPRLPHKRTRSPLHDGDAQHEMLRQHLEEMEKDQRIDSFPFPLAPLAGESAPAEK